MASLKQVAYKQRLQVRWKIMSHGFWSEKCLRQRAKQVQSSWSIKTLGLSEKVKVTSWLHKLNGGRRTGQWVEGIRARRALWTSGFWSEMEATGEHWGEDRPSLTEVSGSLWPLCGYQSREVLVEGEESEVERRRGLEQSHGRDKK